MAVYESLSEFPISTNYYYTTLSGHVSCGILVGPSEGMKRFVVRKSQNFEFSQALF